MTLVVEKGVITAPAGTGNQTYNLGAAFNGILPKALLLWATYETADAIVDGDGIFSMGMGTYRGSTPQQYCTAVFDDDAAAAAATVHQRKANTAILTGLTSDAAEGTATDYEAALVSLVSGTPAQFTLDWTNAPATQIKIHYLALGGTDITDAYVLATAMTTAVATQDIALPSGFGVADLLIFQSHAYTSGFGQGDMRLMMGVAKSDTERRCSIYSSEDGATTMDLATMQKDRAMLAFTGSAAVDAEVDLAAVGTWPTDNVRLSYADQASFAHIFGMLALKGTFLATVDNAQVPTSGAPNAQTLAGPGSGNAKGALFWGAGTVVNGGIDTAPGTAGGFTIGATDGTNEGFAGIVNEDTNTASVVSRFFSAVKAFGRHLAATGGGAASLDAEADGTLSGDDAVLTWNDVGAAAADFNYLILAQTASAISVTLTPAESTTTAQALTTNHPRLYTLTPALGTSEAQQLEYIGAGVELPSLHVHNYGLEYHVDAVLGNDTTGTGSFAQPWATLQKAADYLKATATWPTDEDVVVWIYDGDYKAASSEAATCVTSFNNAARSCSPTRFCIWKAAPGNSPRVMNPSGVTNGKYCFQFQAAADQRNAYQIVDGLELYGEQEVKGGNTGGASVAVYLEGNAADENTMSEVINCHIHGFRASGASASAQGVATWDGTTHCKFAYNEIHDIGSNSGASIDNQEHGLYIQNHHCSVFGNLIYGIPNGYPVQFYGNGVPGAASSIVASNTIDGGQKACIVIPGNTIDAKIIDNILIGAGEYGVEFYPTAFSSSTGSEVRDNIIWDNTLGQLSSVVSTWTKARNHSLDPGLEERFEVDGTPDYTPAAGSSALNLADSDYSTPIDINGAVRPQSGGCDMGAIERSAVISTQYFDLTPATGSSAAQALVEGSPFVGAITPASGTSTAQPLIVTKTIHITLTPASGASVARRLVSPSVSGSGGLARWWRRLLRGAG